MALAVHPERTVLVELGQLRPFSDVYGRHVVRMDGTEKALWDIAQRLQDAGCDVDTSGGDWASPEFNKALELAEAEDATEVRSISAAAAINEVRDLNGDVSRWLRDRDRELQAALNQKRNEVAAAGLLYSGAFLQAQITLKRQALHEYRDEMTRKRRRFRDLCAAVGAGVALPALELTDDARAVLAGWREPATIPGSNDTAAVDDPTSETLEVNLRQFEAKGDGCESLADAAQ
jgi:hypothetical protein